MNSQYIQKNVAFVVGALRTAVQVENNIELSRLALLMPLLMDDLIVSVVNESSLNFFSSTCFELIERSESGNSKDHGDCGTFSNPQRPYILRM